MRKRVDFWKRVYTEVDTYRGFIHDTDRPWIVYENITIKGLNSKQANRKIKNAIWNVRKNLQSAIKKKFRNLNEKEKKYSLNIKTLSSKERKKLLRNIRFQRGMSDRFHDGHSVAHKYLEHIKKIFRSSSVPTELIYLPHVESSFNIKAHSKSDAVGIWQFLRPIGQRLGLIINSQIDERLDPFKSSLAAAELLKQNYKMLGSWPLAVTSYNTGPGILRRAMKKLKTKSLTEIINRYRGRSWGFASKNFYATFVAVYEVSMNWKKYTNLQLWEKEDPLHFESIKTTSPYALPKLLKALGKYKLKFLELNPSFRKKAIKGNLIIPANFTLHLPGELVSKRDNFLRVLE